MPQRGLAVSQRDRSQYDERARAIAAEPTRAPRATRMEALDERGTSAAGGVPGRRTVTIRGQGAERYVPRSRDRRPERRYERTGFRPDRAAMWAVLLCVMMIAAAAMSAHA